MHETVVDNPAPAASEHANMAPAYAGSVRIVDFGNTARSGRTVVFQILEPEDARIHPFDGMRWARATSTTQVGQRLHLVFSTIMPDAGEQDITTLYVGEAVLCWYSNVCAQGMRVVFKLDASPDGEDWHPLNGMVADPKNGDVIFAACWTISDAEEVLSPKAARRQSRPFHTLSAVQQSQIKCRKDERFQNWCCDQVSGTLPSDIQSDLPDFEADPVRYCEQVVRAFCGVESRSEFSQDTANGRHGRDMWHALMRDFDSFIYDRRL